LPLVNVRPETYKAIEQQVQKLRHFQVQLD
jgi:hypothetical protein